MNVSPIESPTSLPLGTVFSIQGVANALKISYSTVFRAVQAGRLLGSRAGGDWRFSSEDVLSYWHSGRTPETEGGTQ